MGKILEKSIQLFSSNFYYSARKILKFALPRQNEHFFYTTNKHVLQTDKIFVFFKSMVKLNFVYTQLQLFISSPKKEPQLFIYIFILLFLLYM